MRLYSSTHLCNSLWRAQRQAACSLSQDLCCLAFSRQESPPVEGLPQPYRVIPVCPSLQAWCQESRALRWAGLSWRWRTANLPLVWAATLSHYLLLFLGEAGRILPVCIRARRCSRDTLYSCSSDLLLTHCMQSDHTSIPNLKRQVSQLDYACEHTMFTSR